MFAPGIIIARWIFRTFMDLSMTRYNVIYGSLTAAIVLIMWIYYLALTALISSEVVSSIQKHRHEKKKLSA